MSLLFSFTFTLVQTKLDLSTENNDDLTEEIVDLSESEGFGELLVFESINEIFCQSFSSKFLVYLSSDFLLACKLKQYSEPLKKNLFSPPELINV